MPVGSAGQPEEERMENTIDAKAEIEALGVKGKPWVLRVGIHRGTITSRDSGSEECESLEECKRRFQAQQTSYYNIGYVIWFAYAISPTGERQELCRGNTNY